MLYGQQHVHWVNFALFTLKLFKPLVVCKGKEEEEEEEEEREEKEEEEDREEEEREEEEEERRRTKIKNMKKMKFSNFILSH